MCACARVTMPFVSAGPTGLSVRARMCVCVHASVRVCACVRVCLCLPVCVCPAIPGLSDTRNDEPVPGIDAVCVGPQSGRPFFAHVNPTLPGGPGLPDALRNDPPRRAALARAAQRSSAHGGARRNVATDAGVQANVPTYSFPMPSRTSVLQRAQVPHTYTNTHTRARASTHKHALTRLHPHPHACACVRTHAHSE
jgi:hypothetical protein